PGGAAFHPAPVTTHHAQPEPHQRPKERRHDGVPPQRPGEGPEQELESDPIGVLDDEDQQDPETGQRRERPTTQFATVRLVPLRLLPTRLNRHHVLLMSRSTGGFGAKFAIWEGRLLWRWPAAVQPRPLRSARHTDNSSWSPGPWGNVAAGADVTLENPARTSSKISTALGGSSPAQELDAPLLEQSNGWLIGSGRLGDRRPKTRRTPCPVPTQGSPKSARTLHGH